MQLKLIGASSADEPSHAVAVRFRVSQTSLAFACVKVSRGWCFSFDMVAVLIFLQQGPRARCRTSRSSNASLCSRQKFCFSKKTVLSCWWPVLSCNRFLSDMLQFW